MFKLRTSSKYNNNYLKFILLVVLFGFLIGFMLYKKIDNTYLINEIKNISNYLHNEHINFLLWHFIIVSVLITSSITIIGLFFIPLYLIYESASIIYNLALFTHIYKLNGFLYGLTYNLLTKGLFLIALITIFKILLKLILTIKEALQKKELNKSIIIGYLKKLIVWIMIIFINDIIIYLLFNKLLNTLLFIIK